MLLLLWIQIRQIRMYLVLLDPDPDILVRGIDPDSDLVPDPNPSIIKQNSKINLDSYCFVNSFCFFIFFKK
jgi:hypothetical protein